MRSTPPLPTEMQPGGKTRHRPFGILIVDDDADVRDALGRALGGGPLALHEAESLVEARAIIDLEPIDLVLVDLSLPDGDGLDFAAELRGRDADLQTIVITGQPSLERAVEAIRVGAADFLSKPLNLDELNLVVAHALRRRSDSSRRHAKIRRLTHLCKKLNKARHDVTQQVDILCNDLVTAYQELAGQMRQIESVSEFKALIATELDLEQVLRSALEFVLRKVGPTNAVIFLPSQGGGWTVGGYINYTCDKESAGVLLNHMACVVAPRLAESGETLHLTDDDDSRHDWLGEQCAWLRGVHILATACRDDNDETLAVVMLFRDPNEPLDTDTRDLLTSIAPAFANHLVKVIHVHHRRNPVLDDDDEDEGDDDNMDSIPF